MSRSGRRSTAIGLDAGLESESRIASPLFHDVMEEPPITIRHRITRTTVGDPFHPGGHFRPAIAGIEHRLETRHESLYGRFDDPSATFDGNVRESTARRHEHRSSRDRGLEDDDGHRV